MNLVCFSSLTAGALVCNLLNKKFTTITAPDVSSEEHNFFKIGDSWNKTYREYNSSRWKTKLMMSNNKFTTEWLGTHCHPSVIECLSVFDRKIAITTTTELSKYYRFLRAYYIFFKKDNSHLNGIIDAMRDDFEPHNACTNIEFSDIVDGTFVKDFNLNNDYFNTWKEHNNFLYNQDPFLLEYFNKGIKNAI